MAPAITTPPLIGAPLDLGDRGTGGSFLVHPARTGTRDVVKKGLRYARLVMPLARTLRCKLVRKPWDGVTVPSATIGAGMSLNELVDDIAKKILGTPGGDAYLSTNRLERALGVLAASGAALLRDPDYCQRSKRTGRTTPRGW